MILSKHIHFIFPQFTRFFSAKPTRVIIKAAGTTLLWAGIGTLVVLNASLLTFHPIPNTQKAAATDHIRQAHKLWKLGEYNQARLELRAALTRESISIQIANSEKMSSVLGITNDQSVESSEDASRDELEDQHQYWQTIVSKQPQYRDGWLALAILAYKLDNMEEVRVYLDRIKLIDPNNPTAQSLEGLIAQRAK